MKPRIEWAVLESVFRGTKVVKGGLGSREEAEAWLAALTITTARQDHEHFMATDGIMMREELFIGFREVRPWQSVGGKDSAPEVRPSSSGDKPEDAGCVNNLASGAE